MTAEPITLDTPYGPLSLRLYAGPTSNLDTCYARDGGSPDRAHTFGRVPVAPYIGARVSSPETHDDGRRDYAYLTINGVAYSADTGYALTVGGWVEEHGGYGALTRRGTFLTDTGAVTDGARKVWRERILPLIVAALTAADTAPAVAAARAEYEANVRARIAELRTEADRLAAMVNGLPFRAAATA